MASGIQFFCTSAVMSNMVSSLNATITSYIMSVTWSKGLAAPYDIVGRDNTATIVLKNSDKRFSPNNTSGPYYPYFSKGNSFFVTIGAYNNGAATGYDLDYYGYITNIDPTSGTTQERTCTVTCEGWFGRAMRTPVNMAVYNDILVNIALERLVENSPVPPYYGWAKTQNAFGVSNFNGGTYFLNGATFLGGTTETAATTIGTIGDWMDGQTVYGAARDIVQREGGGKIFQGDGKLVFWNRTHKTDTSTVSATFTNAQTSMTTSYGDLIRNQITVRYATRGVGTSISTVGTCADSVSVTSGGDTRVSIDYRDPSTGLFISSNNIIPPVGGVDFTATTSTGANKDTEIKATLIQDKGNGAIFNFHNYSGSDVTLTGLVVRGTKLNVTASGEVTVTDDTSILAYGLQSYTWDGEVETRALAVTLAAALLAEFKDPKTRITNYTPRMATLTDIVKIGNFTNRITITETQTGITSDDYFVVGENVQWSPGNFSLSWVLEPA